jgi:hypothetical protein
MPVSVTSGPLIGCLDRPDLHVGRGWPVGPTAERTAVNRRRSRAIRETGVFASLRIPK